MNKAVYDRLMEVARAATLVYYAQIAPLADLNMDRQADRNAIGDTLGEISTWEHEHDRPLLSAVVIQAGSEYPGKGFFTLARDLGLYDGADDLAFWAAEVSRVHEHWTKAQ